MRKEPDYASLRGLVVKTDDCKRFKEIPKGITRIKGGLLVGKDTEKDGLCPVFDKRGKVHFVRK